MIDLDNVEAIKSIDKEDFCHTIIHMPEQDWEAYFKTNIVNKERINKSAINKVIFVGMGGSAIAGDIIKTLFGKQIDIQVVKDYYLPYFDEKTLFIFCSYSGNTEETLSCMHIAKSKKANIWGITTGGLLEKALGDEYAFIKIREGFPPRSAIAYLFFSVVRILELQGIIKEQKDTVKKVVASLMTKAGALTKTVPSMLNLAKSAAQQINGKLPLIYSVNNKLDPIAYRWKCQINENAKYPAFYHTFPEMNHNEIEGWEHKEFSKQFMPIFLRFFNDEKHYEKRLDAFKNLLKQQDVDYLEFFADGDTEMVQLFSLIYLGDMISYYIAILNETDPIAIEFINYLKEKIK
jgi:glucose/mannose-6-phosphate isomerase